MKLDRCQNIHNSSVLDVWGFDVNDTVWCVIQLTKCELLKTNDIHKYFCLNQLLAGYECELISSGYYFLTNKSKYITIDN